MTLRRQASHRPLALLLLAACGSSAPGEPAAIVELSPAAPAPEPVADGPTVTAPTVLSDEQRRRDAEYLPLATAIADAYPNTIGWISPFIGEWSPDGKNFLFASHRAGTPQLYVGAPSRPGDPPRALTTGQERAIWGTHTADGNYVLFLRDRGGDERYHIWRVGADGSGPIDLTPTTTAICDTPQVVRDQPDIMVYSEMNFDAPESRVYVKSIAGGPSRLVYTTNAVGGLGDVTPDGRHGLFTHYHAADDVVVSELDLASGALRRVYPREGNKARLATPTYSADASRLFLISDEGGETQVALAIDVATGEELARYTDAARPHTPLTLYAPPAGDHLILHVDAGDHGELRVLDARTLALVRSIEVPLAEIQAGTFRPDGGEFAISMSLPDRPPDVYAVDPSSGEVRPLRADPRPELDALAPMTTAIAQVPAHDGLTIPINVYLPASAPGAAVVRRPTLVIFHGGPAANAAVRWDSYVRFFVSLGYAVLEPNVRGSRGYGRAYEDADNLEKRADWLEDVATVNAWAKAQPWCDPTRVAVWGGSYGGYTTLMALTRQPTDWRAGVDLYGMADLRSLLRSTPLALRKHMADEFGDLDRDAALLAEFSPLRDVDKIVAPLFVYAGQNDPRVPRSESDAIVQALRDRWSKVEYMVALDEGHNVERRDNKIELLTRTARFLADAMGPP